MNTITQYVSHLDALIDRYGARIGRILIGVLFLVSGISALMGFQGFIGYTAMFLPAATLMASLAVFFKLAGGLGLILGVRTRLSSYILIFFVLMTVLFIHAPSLMKSTDKMTSQSEMVAILKNLAVIGGLLMVAKSAPLSLSNSSVTAQT